VDAERLAVLKHFVVVGQDETAVARRAKVLGHVEADSRGDAIVAGVLAVVVAGDGLSGVLDDEEVVLLGKGGERIDVDELPEEVDREDRLGLRSERFGQLIGVNVERIGEDIHEHGHCAELHDNFDARHECEGGGDDFVAWADACCLERDAKGVGSAVDGQPVLHAMHGRDAFFELFVEFAEHKSAAAQDAEHRRVHDFLYFTVLGLEV